MKIKFSLPLIAMAIAGAAAAQTAASLSPNPNLQFFDTSSGQSLPCVNCTLSTFAAGTNTPLRTYTDSSKTTQNPVIITLDARGYTTSGIWIGPQCYKYVLANALGGTVWSQDFICDNAQLLKALLAGSTGAAQIGYEASGSSTLRTVQRKLDEIATVTDFGADTTGATSSVAAFNAALSHVVGGTGGAGTLTIPTGLYKIDDTITTPTASGLVVRGSGEGSKLIWSGNNATKDVLLIPNCFACRFENFQIYATNAGKAAIQTENAGLSYTASQDVFEGIKVEGNANIETCFLIDGPVDGNNDQQVYRDSHCYTPSVAAWQLGNATGGFNVFNVIMDHSSYLCAGFCQYGVWQRHGNFHWRDGDGSGATGADFRLETLPSGNISVENSEFENSKQLLTTSASGALAGTVSLHDVDWDGGCLGQTQDEIKMNCPDGPIAGPMVSFSFNGPLFAWNNRLGALANSVLATIALNLSPSGFPAATEFRDNIFGSIGIGAASGKVTTSGTAVTWVSGTLFSATGQYNAQAITIAGSAYTIASCASSIACTLTGSAGTHSAPVDYSMTQTLFNANLPTVLSNNLAQCRDCTAPTRLTDYLYNDLTLAGNVNATGMLNYTPATQTYTPAVAFGGASTGITYSTDTGTYLVENGFTNFGVNIVLSSVGSATGTTSISLPGTASTFGSGTCIVTANGSSVSTLVPIILTGENVLRLDTQGTTGSGSLTNSNFTNTTAIFCVGRYN